MDQRESALIMDEPIFKFDKSKHDERVKERVKEQLLHKAEGIWARFKNRILKLPKKQRTQKHIVKLTVNLRNELYLLTEPEDLQQWKSYTMEIIDNLIERINVSMGLSDNEFTAYIPSTLRKDENVFGESHKFRVLTDFSVIPTVALVRAREGFVGFLRDGLTICALWKDGETTPVGRVKHNEGLVMIPTVKDYRKELKSSGSTGPGSETGSALTGSDSPGPESGGYTP